MGFTNNNGDISLGSILTAMQTVQDATAMSLTQYTQQATVNSRVFIDQKIANEEVIAPLLTTQMNLYAGLIMTALSMNNYITSSKRVRDLIAIVATENYTQNFASNYDLVKSFAGMESYPRLEGMAEDDTAAATGVDALDSGTATTDDTDIQEIVDVPGNESIIGMMTNFALLGIVGVIAADSYMRGAYNKFGPKHLTWYVHKDSRRVHAVELLWVECIGGVATKRRHKLEELEGRVLGAGDKPGDARIEVMAEEWCLTYAQLKSMSTIHVIDESNGSTDKAAAEAKNLWALDKDDYELCCAIMAMRKANGNQDNAEKLVKNIGKKNKSTKKASNEAFTMYDTDVFNDLDNNGDYGLRHSYGTRNAEYVKDQDKTHDLPLPSGRILNITTNTDCGATVNFNIMLNLNPTFIPPEVMSAFIALNFSPSIRQRYLMLKAGEISTIKDFVFGMDMRHQRFDALRKDKTGALREMIDRQENSRANAWLKLLQIQPNNMNIANTILVYDKYNLDTACSNAGVRLNDFDSRQKFFNMALAMMLVSVDPMYNRIEIYYHGMKNYSQFTFDQVKKASKNDKATDLLQVMKNYANGMAPKF